LITKFVVYPCNTCDYMGTISMNNEI